MKAAFLLISIALLSLVSSCARQIQPIQGSKPSDQASPQSQPSATVSERGTPAEARAMLQKAVDHYNSVGREQALSDFNHKKAPFGDRDLYVVCIGPHDKLTANGGFPQYVGLSPDILKDAEGKPLGKSIWETGNSKGEGSVEHLMTNPVSRKIERKITFVQKIGDDVCGVGAYNP
jgi:cytochrome c